MSHSPVLDGRWQMIRAEFDGDPAPELVIAKTTLELAGNKYAIRFDREVMDEGIFTVPFEVPGRLTMLLSGTRGTNAGRTIPAIFQRTGDRLRICFGFGGVAPADFTTSTGPNLYMATYRRITT